MSLVLFPPKDYVSPGFERISLDEHFPNMIVSETSTIPWPYLRQTGEHNWYRDARVPNVGFVNRDEAHILYNTALKFRGKPALEVGCFFGWSACHLAAGGVELDVVDPGLGKQDILDSVASSLASAGVRNRVQLWNGFSPGAVKWLVETRKRVWDLIFIDGNHDFPAPVNDAVECERHCSENAMVLFHDLLSPHVAEGLHYFHERGWKTRIFMTSQIMGCAWRGNVEPVEHHPDPSANWEVPKHLQGWPEWTP